MRIFGDNHDIMKTENIAKKLDFVDFLSFENDFSKVEI
jgi:hypothetical protein